MSNLRNQIIRLAHAKPELREDLLPLLEKQAMFGNASLGSIQTAVKEIQDKMKSGGAEYLTGTKAGSFNDDLYFLDEQIQSYVSNTAHPLMRDMATHRKALIALFRIINSLPAAFGYDQIPHSWNDESAETIQSMRVLKNQIEGMAEVIEAIRSDRMD